MIVVGLYSSAFIYTVRFGNVGFFRTRYMRISKSEGKALKSVTHRFYYLSYGISSIRLHVIKRPSIQPKDRPPILTSMAASLTVRVRYTARQSLNRVPRCV